MQLRLSACRRIWVGLSKEVATPLRYAYVLDACVMLFLKGMDVGIRFLAVRLGDVSDPLSTSGIMFAAAKILTSNPDRINELRDLL